MTWTAAHLERLRRLPSEARDRVLERACILFHNGVVQTWEEADERAYEMEITRQRALWREVDNG